MKELDLTTIRKPLPKAVISDYQRERRAERPTASEPAPYKPRETKRAIRLEPSRATQVWND